MKNGRKLTHLMDGQLQKKTIEKLYLNKILMLLKDNEDPYQSYKMGINQFTIYTDS